MKLRRLPLLFVLVLFLASCTEVELASHLGKQAMPPSKTQGTFKVGTPYKIDGRRYYPKESYDLVETGIASWYGPNFHGKQTANGEIFDQNELTAAHRTLQMPSLVRVTNLENGRSLIVRINDRGPYSKGRVIDLSKRAAELLGYKVKGTAKVKLEVLKQESLQIAQAAKSGINTNGYEVALNRGQNMPATATRSASIQPAAGKAVRSPGAVEQSTLTVSSDRAPVKTTVPGHVRNGAFYPEEIVTEMPVTKTDIFVQAGSFSVPENAYKLSTKLQRFAPSDVYPAMVNGTQYYRVRLGPIQNVAHADRLLAQLSAEGNNNAIIVVE